MLCNIYTYSDRIFAYESSASCGTMSYLTPFIKEMVKFLENIRKQSFQCYVRCDQPFNDSSYHYFTKHDVGVIYLQIHEDPRYLIRLLSHELCHYTMDNHAAIEHPKTHRKMSSYEEVFAEMFMLLQIKKSIQWFRQMSNSICEDLMTRYQESIYQEHKCQHEILLQEGIQAIPLLDETFLPLYDNCRAVAHYLLPYFESKPELWMILAHVQNVHPQSSWNEFFDYLQKTADDSYRGSLDEMIKILFP